jgi:ABC-type uncharacterized transport system substrate-binding protein
MPLIGMFMNLAEDDGEISTRRDAFLQGLGPMSNLTIAMRFGGDGGGRIVDYTTYPMKANALAKLDPDLYVCSCWPTLRALLNATIKPIVFAGLVDLTANPASHYDTNVFGFIDYGTNLCAQWPAYLSQIAPIVTRAAVVYDVHSGLPQVDAVYDAIDAAKGALTLGKIDVRSTTLANDIQDFANCAGAFANSISGSPCSPGGLIVPAGTPMATIRKTIIKAAADNNLPAIYANRLYVIDGGLISRGTYTPNLYLKAGDYAKQILKGTPPKQQIDMTQTGKDAVFETVKLNTAKALGGNILTNAMAMAADLVIDPDP